MIMLFPMQSGGGFKTCTIVGTISEYIQVQRKNKNTGVWEGVYVSQPSSRVTIVINLEDGTYSISGNSTSGTTNDVNATSTYVSHRAYSSASFTITSITFE